MEGIYYGYVLQAQMKIRENEKKIQSTTKENTLEISSSSNHKTNSLFGDHDQKTTLNIGSYSTINYNTFLNPTFIKSKNLE